MFSVLISIMGCILSGTISARGIEPPPVLDPSLIKKLERRIDHPVEKSSLKEFPSEGLRREFVSEDDEFGGSKDDASVSNENSRAAEQRKIADEKIHPNKRLLSNSFKNSDQNQFPKAKNSRIQSNLNDYCPVREEPAKCNERFFGRTAPRCEEIK